MVVRLGVLNKLISKNFLVNGVGGGKQTHSKNFLVYLFIWSTLHKVFGVPFLCLYDVPWASFYVHIIGEKSFLLYYVLTISL